MNNFKCMFYEEKVVNGEECFKCKNIKYGQQACQVKGEFCGYFENCECCKNKDTDKCNDCYIGLPSDEEAFEND